MDIFFSSRKLQKSFSSQKELNKIYGQRAKKIRQRLAELNAAETLAEMSSLPPARCHELEGKREGQFAVDISGNHRLIFRPNHVPVSKKEDGAIDLDAVTEIEILAVEDYHGN